MSGQFVWNAIRTNYVGHVKLIKKKKSTLKCFLSNK